MARPDPDDGRKSTSRFDFQETSKKAGTWTLEVRSRDWGWGGAVKLGELVLSGDLRGTLTARLTGWD